MATEARRPAAAVVDNSARAGDSADMTRPPVPDPAPPDSGAARERGVRLAVRAVILHAGRLLVVNAWPGGVSDLWCAPGGGVEPGRSLPDNLIREVWEETGLTITVGAPCLVNEFHDPASGFHQCDVYFRATLTGGLRPPGFGGGDVPGNGLEGGLDGWRDPAGVVDRRRFVTEAELRQLRFKPDSLPAVAWGAGLLYDPLEPLLR